MRRTWSSLFSFNRGFVESGRVVGLSGTAQVAELLHLRKWKRRASVLLRDNESETIREEHSLRGICSVKRDFVRAGTHSPTICRSLILGI